METGPRGLLSDARDRPERLDRARWSSEDVDRLGTAVAGYVQPMRARALRLSLAGLAAVLLVSTGFPATAQAAQGCQPITASGHRFTGIKAYAIPCSLGYGAIRRWTTLRFRAVEVTFRWHGMPADFICYFSHSAPPEGKCKGGVFNGRRVPYYGTVDWARST